MKKNLVSIITPMYNSEKFIEANHKISIKPNLSRMGNVNY